MREMKFLVALMLVFGFALAIQPVETWTSGPQEKISYTEKPFETEGGNVTELNITQNISTEKWAGVYGQLSGYIVLSDGSHNFYEWTWTPADGGVICGQPSSTANFDWTSAAATTAGEVDSAFSFTTTDTDSATSTLTGTCSLTISGSSITGAPSVTVDSWNTCAIKDAATPSKADLAFCTTILNDQTLYDGTSTGDYQLLLPTNENEGQIETYVFWVELQ